MLYHHDQRGGVFFYSDNHGKPLLTHTMNVFFFCLGRRRTQTLTLELLGLVSLCAVTYAEFAGGILGPMPGLRVTIDSFTLV